MPSRGAGSALSSQWLTATIFHIVLCLISSSGFLLCGVGILFTGPLYSLSIALLFHEFFRGPDAFAEETARRSVRRLRIVPEAWEEGSRAFFAWRGTQRERLRTPPWVEPAGASRKTPGSMRK